MLRRLVDRYLDPSESLLEILFGLIMALTMTAGARLVADPATLDARELIVALAGCDIAWGLIDAVFYLLGSIFNRNRRLELVRRLHGDQHEGEAIVLIRDEFDPRGEPRMRDEDKALVYGSMLEMSRCAECAARRFAASELPAAAIIFVLVALTAVPGLIPLGVMSDVEHGAAARQRAAGAAALLRRLQVVVLLPDAIRGVVRP